MNGLCDFSTHIYSDFSNDWREEAVFPEGTNGCTTYSYCRARLGIIWVDSCIDFLVCQRGVIYVVRRLLMATCNVIFSACHYRFPASNTHLSQLGSSLVLDDEYHDLHSMKMKFGVKESWRFKMIDCTLLCWCLIIKVLTIDTRPLATMTVVPVNVASLKKVKNTVIGNPSAKKKIAQDVLLIQSYVWHVASLHYVYTALVWSLVLTHHMHVLRFLVLTIMHLDKKMTRYG